MNKIKTIVGLLVDNLSRHRRVLIALTIVIGLIISLFLRELVSLPGGMSTAEHVIATTPVGWSGIINDPFYLPMKVIRSIGFFWFDSGGALVSRLPSVIFGLIAVLAVGYVVYVWHGKRIAVLTTTLFATSAWTLHVSRYASYDSNYLVAIPLLLATIILLQRSKRTFIPYLVLFIWSILLFTPGLVWPVLFTVFWQRYSLADAWRNANSWVRKAGLATAGLILLPLLAYSLATSSDYAMTWAGLPVNFGSAADFGTRLLNVPLNLFVAGPDTPELWLGRLPVLDVIVTIFTILGAAYYLQRRRAGRAQLLGIFLLLSILLIGLGGAVSLSLIVPVIFIIAGAGIAQFYGDWLKRFPRNPLARSFGTTLIVITILMSATYNLRNYFIAWPSAPATLNRFDKQ